jgi:protein required for attachment to host cells
MARSEGRHELAKDPAQCVRVCLRWSQGSVSAQKGDATFPNLKTEKVFQDENPDTHEQGSDRPGCLSKPSGQRSAVEPVDWHDLEEHRFARRVVAEMEQVVREHKAKALVVVAPPRTLADLRGAFHGDVKARIIAEIPKDLTGHPVGDIEQHLAAES